MFAGKPIENITVNYLTKHMAYIFYMFHICFSLSVLKKQTQYTYVWRLKDVKAQREEHVATRLPRL